MTVQELIHRRDEALLSFDPYEIKRFMRCWGIPVPEDDLEFWRRVYSAVLAIPNAPKSARRRAEYWLGEYRKGVTYDGRTAG